jgi:hypothetical protein
MLKVYTFVQSRSRVAARLPAMGDVYYDLASHDAVGDDDAAVVGGDQGGIPEGEPFDGGGFEACGGGDLDLVADVEGTIEDEGEAGDEIAQGGLGGQADDDRDDRDAGEQNVAEAVELGNQVDVERDGEDIDGHADDLAEELEGGLVDEEQFVALDDAVECSAGEARGEVGEGDENDCVEKRACGGAGLEQFDSENFVDIVGDGRAHCGINFSWFESHAAAKAAVCAGAGGAVVTAGSAAGVHGSSSTAAAVAGIALAGQSGVVVT